MIDNRDLENEVRIENFDEVIDLKNVDINTKILNIKTQESAINESVTSMMSCTVLNEENKSSLGQLTLQNLKFTRVITEASGISKMNIT